MVKNREEGQHVLNVNGNVQGVVQGPGNNVTLVFNNGEERTIPFLAPPLPAHELVGRGALLAQAKQVLLRGDSAALLALNGLPGIGKTALALALAHDREVLARFQDGVLWAGLGYNGDAQARLSTWAAALGIPRESIADPTSVDHWARALRSAIGMRRMLLVVDDAWQVEAALAFKVGGPNCAHMVTTRLPQVALDFAGGEPLAVRELNEDDGVALLASLAPQVVAAEPEEVRALVQAVDGLPLALTIMGNYLRKEGHSGQPRRIRAALQRLHQTKERMQLQMPQSPLEQHPSLSNTPLSLKAAIEVSYQGLGERARLTLAALQCYSAKPNTFSEQAVLEIADCSTETVDALTDSGLLESSGAQRYTLHQSIHDYLAVIPVDIEVPVRFIRHYLTILYEKQKRYEELEPEIDNVFSALQLTTREEVQLFYAFVHGVNDLFSYLVARGQYEIADVLLEGAVHAAEANGFVEQQAQALRNLGILADLRRDYEEAEMLHLRSLALSREAGNIYGVASTLLNLGVLFIRQNDMDKGEQYLSEAIDITRGEGYDALLSNLLLNRATVEMSRGNYIKAKEYLLEGLPLARQSGDLEYLGGTLTNLARTELALGNTEEAEKCMEESLTLARDVGHARNYQVFGNAATMALEKGDTDKARQRLIEAFTLASRARDPIAASSILTRLGWLAHQDEDYGEAERYMQQALWLVREFEDTEQLPEALLALGWVVGYSGDHARAEPYLQEALATARNS